MELLTKGGGMEFVDRGDNMGADFDETTLTGDGLPHEMDLSAIVPVGTKLVQLNVGLQAATPGTFFAIYKNGYSNFTNVGMILAQVANLQTVHEVWIPCDADRKVNYSSTFVLATDLLSVAVRGWIL